MLTVSIEAFKVKNPRSKLSRMQKTTLKHLKDTGKHGIYVTTLSHLVAEELDKDGDKILDRGKAKQGVIRDMEKGKISVEHGKLFLELHRMREKNYRTKERVLSSSFRASFSRSLKRLEKRGLIESIVKAECEIDGQLYHYIRGDGKTNRVILTEKGKETAKKLTLEKKREPSLQRGCGGGEHRKK